jgi:hypothetical protein
MSVSRWFAGLVACALGCGQPPLIVGDGGVDAGADGGASTPKPHVLLLVDTSGSTTYRADCQCQSFGACPECLPDCTTTGRPRWHDMLAAISGSFEDYSCTALERSAENGATYDLGYIYPFHRLGAGVGQQADGLLDRYRDKVHFGLATFDGMRTYVGAGDLVTTFDFTRSIGVDGLYSYGGAPGGRIRPDGTVVGRVGYPSVTQAHFTDTGIRSAAASDGALILPHEHSDPADAVEHIKQQLAAVRPFGGTPIASALDDLYLAFTENVAVEPDAKRYVILLTDGYPDDDFREYPTPGCDCVARGNCPAGEDLSLMSCPYPTAMEAARVLRCGYDPSTCAGRVAATHVVTLSLADPISQGAMDDIAAAGGGDAIHAYNAQSLSAALDAVMSSILAP